MRNWSEGANASACGREVPPTWGLAAARLMVVAILGTACPDVASGEPVHAIAMHGKPALEAGFAHFPYVNAAAPKGGRLKLGQLGSFDSLNPFIIKGVAPSGVREYVYESLLERSADEPFTLYGHLARTMDLPDDRSSVTFHMDPEARFSDGRPVTVEDVAFSWELLKEKGRPFHRAHYSTVAKVEMLGPGAIRFAFGPHGNREAPLLLGLMPILPKHLISKETFDRTSLEAPIGSGPYRVGPLETGRSMTYVRDAKWWARDKPTARGRYNFDQIAIEYFRDQTALFEAFKAGDVDVRVEDDAGRWTEAYDFPAVKDGKIIKAELETGLPSGMTALVLNTRREVFADVRVRRALNLMFDFEWINSRLFHGAYTRTQSYFERSELSSVGRPAGDAERALLTRIGAKVRPDVLDGTARQPSGDGRGRNRDNLRAAMGLLREAGYVQKDGKLVHGKSGKPLAFEMMAAKRAEERLFQAFARTMTRLGIDVSIRPVDSAQRWERLKAFDFDVIQWTWGASLSPGNEQVNRWGVASAGTEGSLNFAGVKDPAVDAVIDVLLAARERPEFETAVRAFDRILLSGDYVIPLYHQKSIWLAARASLGRPAKSPLSGLELDTWWGDAGGAAGTRAEK